MIVTIPTGSQMDRIVRCPASAALPQVHDANESSFRDRGTAMHAFLARVPEVGREAALAEVDEAHRDFCATIELARLADRLTLSREVALAYDWRRDTARRLQVLDHRAYEVDETCEVPLTVDLAGVSADSVFVGDYKSGHGWLPAPNQSMQLGLGVLALARLHNVRKAQIEYIRILDDGTPLRFSAVLDVFGLEGFAERMFETMQAVEQLRGSVAAGTVPNVVEGPWCRYCPAKMHCPAKTALIRHVMTDPQPVPYVLPLTPERASQAYTMLKKAREALAQIESALYAYAKLTPIPVGVDEDGSHRWFGELRRPGNDVLDGAITHAVIAETYGGEVANTVVTMEATKKAVTDAARKHLQPGEKVTKVTEKIFETIRERKGISNPETCTTTEYVVSADGEAKAKKKRRAG